MSNVLDKFSVSLAIAFSISDGPFDVLVNGEQKCQNLSKQEVETLANDPGVISIDLDRREGDRRWRERGY